MSGEDETGIQRGSFRQPWKVVGALGLSLGLPLLFFSLVGSNLGTSLAIGVFGVLPLLVIAAGYFESPRERGGTSYEEGELFEQFRDAAAAHGLRADWTHVGDKFQITIDGLMPELSLVKETIGTGVSKRLTGADVEIGDPVFDDAALVTGASLEILSRLNHEQRARTHSLLKVGGSISVGVLSVSVSRLSDVLDRLSHLSLTDSLLSPEAMDVVALARGFSAIVEGTKEERLLGILHEDPNPSVRDKVLFEMMRHRDELELDLDGLLVEMILGHFARVASIHGQLQSNEELSQEAMKLADITEAKACEVLRELGHGALAAAYWLREHGESAECVAALSEVLTESPSQEVTAVAGQALAAIRSRLGRFAGGLALSESQDAGALSLAERGGQLALSEDGQVSVAEEEAERKRRAAVERQKG